jgi:hypothetical protein
MLTHLDGLTRGGSWHNTDDHSLPLQFLLPKSSTIQSW